MSAESGLTTWRRESNHNRMIELQARGGDPDAAGPVKLAHFASSAFRITSPAGLTLMLDPWRNLPPRTWDWYFHDFPETAVDIGVSTHAHFDHDALHRLDASVLLDRPIGTFAIADVRVTGIADKHAVDSTYATYDMRLINGRMGGQKLDPPDNARSWDNVLTLVETGGLRLLHWGDNRPDPPDEVWQRLGRVDVLLMPVDDSQHVMGNVKVDEVIARLQPRVVVPHHYYIWSIVQRQSTLLPVDGWVGAQSQVRRVEAGEVTYRADDLPDATRVDHFGDHVAFDVAAWHAAHGMAFKPEP
ncbi:MAG: MBL fold metallo-hydrolase [Pseudomonadota bacterium]